MWNRTLHISPFAKYLDWINRILPGGEKHAIPMPSDRDIHGLIARTPQHLFFTAREEQRGLAALRKLGIPENTPFVCFHARDSAYLSALFPNTNCHYHDYRDSNIYHYVPAAGEMTRRGCFAIRTGAIVQEALTTTNPMIIDYATKCRSDFLDIFLGAKCHFYFGAASGFSAIPPIFRRPLAIVNHIPLDYAPTWFPYALFIPKKLWLKAERRFLTFREIFDSGIGRFLETEQYEQLGIEVIENTPEEITALVVEMDERLKGTWQTIEEDEELQRRFRSLLKPGHLCHGSPSRIGAEFLRQNRDLLG